MLNCIIKGYKRPCQPNVGGISNLYVGDANDFEFTEGASVGGDTPGYSTISYRSGASGLPVTAQPASATASITTSYANGEVVNVVISDTSLSGSALNATIIATYTKVSGDGTGTAVATAIKALITTNAPTLGLSGTGTDIIVAGPTGSDATYNGKFLTLTSTTSGYQEVVFAGGRAASAGGAYLYEINSLDESISFKATQSYTDGSVEYAYEIKAKAAKFGQSLTNFSKKMDAAALCCQLVFVVRANDGSYLVAGEKYVGGLELPKWRIRQDGSVFELGTVFKSFNGGDLSFKGTYLRAPYEFVGGPGALAAFIAP